MEFDSVRLMFKERVALWSGRLILDVVRALDAIPVLILFSNFALNRSQYLLPGRIILAVHVPFKRNTNLIRYPREILGVQIPGFLFWNVQDICWA